MECIEGEEGLKVRGGMQGRTVRKCMVEGPKVRGVGKKGNSKMGGWTGKKVRGGGKEGERKGPYTYLALAMAKRMMEGGMDGGRGKET